MTGFSLLGELYCQSISVYMFLFPLKQCTDNELWIPNEEQQPGMDRWKCGFSEVLYSPSLRI